MQRAWAMDAPIAAAIAEGPLLARLYRELEQFILMRAAAEIRRLRAQPGVTGMPTVPSQQLSELLKSAQRGGLRGAVARAVDSLGRGQAAFSDLHATISDYESAVADAQALSAFVRGELQAEGSNGGPPGETLGNSATGSSSGSVAATPSDGSQAQPGDGGQETRASGFSNVHPSLRRPAGT